jgi:Protein of unknown function (DUF3987)
VNAGELRAEVTRLHALGWQSWEITEVVGRARAAEVDQVLAELDSRATPRAVSANSAESPRPEDLLAPTALSAHTQENDGTGWPTLYPAAYHGLAGQVVRALEPHSEADPAGMLAVLLAAFGNLTGPGPHAVAGAANHPPRLNVVLVGDTSRSRKGTAQAAVDQVLALAAPTWFADQVRSGLASGEGLIAAVRDGDGDDLGTLDRRLLVVEPEFARVLAVAGRDGSTLSAILRQLYDSGTVRVMTRRDPLRATGVHVSVIGHVTQEELRRSLSVVEAANGFGNRLLYVCVRRSKLLPHGGHHDPALLDHLAAQVAAAVDRAQRVGAMTRSAAANLAWEQAYTRWAQQVPGGLAGALTARPEAHALRLSLAYALLDGSPVIEPEHVAAAVAVVDYAEQSARYVFGDALGDDIADRLLEELRAAGAEGLDGETQRALFSRHVKADRLAQARAELERRGLITTERQETGGRPRLVSRAVTR